jgi:hypothetical protein
MKAVLDGLADARIGPQQQQWKQRRPHAWPWQQPEHVLPCMRAFADYHFARSTLFDGAPIHDHAEVGWRTPLSVFTITITIAIASLFISLLPLLLLLL